LETKPLTITAYFDTRQGHIKQTRGLIRALSDLTPVQVREILLPEYGVRQALYDWMHFVASFFSSRQKQISSDKNDLIIGTGTHTHIPMLLQKRQNGGRVITCMMPELPLLRYIDLCFVPEHDSPPDRKNIFITQGPPNTALNKTPPNTALNKTIDRQEQDPPKGLILIGGVDNKTHIWNNEQIIDQIQAVLKMQTDICWTISTSPRTPDKMLSLLENLTKNFPCTIFMPFEKTGQGWIEEQYAESGFVWVSADSVSMVFEALSAECRVGVLSVDWKEKRKKNTNKIAHAIKLLEQKKIIISFENFMNKAEYPAQEALNEAGRCAEEILRRWRPNSLP
jgi:uncharacterized protein